MMEAIRFLSEEDLIQIAYDINAKLIFSSGMISTKEPNLLIEIFIPFVNVIHDKDYTKDIGIIYEYLTEKIGEIKGYPCFLSYQLIHKDQIPRLTELYYILTNTNLLYTIGEN